MTPPNPNSLAPAFALLCVLAAAPALAATETIETSKVGVSFHISHPAKEYDAFLLPDGGRATLVIDPLAVENTKASIVIKVDHFNSDNTRRDSHMIETMEALVYPTIQWTVESIIGLSGPLKPGAHKARALGPLTVHGVTRPLEAAIELTVGGQGELTVGASFSVLLEDFGIERPTLVFVPIENEVQILVEVHTRPSPSLLAGVRAPEPVAPPGPAEDAVQ